MSEPTIKTILALAERHNLRITIRGDGSIIGVPDDLHKLRVLLALRPLLNRK